VFEKTQYKVLKSASAMCGTIVEPLMTVPIIESSMSLEEKLVRYHESVHPVLTDGREEKQGRVEKAETK
jgi:hypothetical protein